MELDFSRLETLSQVLNESSDELTEAIQHVEKKLASLRLGVNAFSEPPLETKKYTSTKGEHTYNYTLAYTKGVSGWGLVVWECDENNDNYVKDEVPLLEAPRHQRVAAMHRLPDLLKQLELKAEDVISEVTGALNAAKSF